MDTHQHTASLAEKDSTGEKSSAEEGLASFNTVKYWNDFYDPEQGGDCDEFDWYSTEEWLPQCVEGITASRPHLARRPLCLLDVGVGTCPLIPPAGLGRCRACLLLASTSLPQSGRPRAPRRG